MSTQFDYLVSFFSPVGTFSGNFLYRGGLTIGYILITDFFFSFRILIFKGFDGIVTR